MNKKAFVEHKGKFEETERTPIERDDFEKAIKRLVLAPAEDRPRSKNREPTMKELNQRFKLEQR